MARGACACARALAAPAAPHRCLRLVLLLHLVHRLLEVGRRARRVAHGCGRGAAGACTCAAVSRCVPRALARAARCPAPLPGCCGRVAPPAVSDRLAGASGGSGGLAQAVGSSQGSSGHDSQLPADLGGKGADTKRRADGQLGNCYALGEAPPPQEHHSLATHSRGTLAAWAAAAPNPPYSHWPLV